MPSNIQIDCIDVHVEVPPPGGCVPVPHRFLAKPRSKCGFIQSSGSPLVEGDSFSNEAVPDHTQPKTGGSFANGAPSGEGSFTSAGQTFVLVQGVPWMTLAGRVKTCSDGLEERSVAAAVVRVQKSFLFINGSIALTGAPSE